MNTIVDRSNKIKSYISNQNNSEKISIIAVSKTFDLEYIRPLVDSGHIHFGENKVQEAMEKWTSIKKKNKSLKLHMIGKLQTNKVKFAIELFDYIHSVDNERLAKKISEEQKKTNLKPKIFIQINMGKENQKSGVNIKDFSYLYKFCKSIDLNVIGTMCLPPLDQNPSYFFEMMAKVNKEYNLCELSMGMSSDYIEALKFQSTYLRIGSKIFGKRI